MMFSYESLWRENGALWCLASAFKGEIYGFCFDLVMYKG